MTDDPARCLVVGIGNDLRRDDGVGHVVAAAVGRRLPEVDVLLVRQVVPELAVTLLDYRAVVFVDASVDGAPDGPAVAVAALPAVTPRTAAGHIGSPGAAVALVPAIGGTAPRAWLVTIRVTDTALGEGLSAATDALVAEAVDAVARQLRAAGRRV